MRLASVHGGPVVYYRINLDGTLDRRNEGGDWHQVLMDEMGRGVLEIWLSEPIPMHRT
jgi:hypothetical protein